MKPAILILSTLLATPGFSETLVATRIVRPNAIITQDDFMVSDKIIPGALTEGDDIAGLEAKATLYAGRPIMPQQVGAPALVERNQPVTVIFQQGGLVISTEARALSRGAVGEIVRVMNLSSRATVSGLVQLDGSVHVSAGGHDR